MEVHVEFTLARRSNSGVYFMGRYELQVYDSYGVAKDQYPGIECGGIYPRYDSTRHEYEGHSPLVNTSSPTIGLMPKRTAPAAPAKPICDSA